MRFFNKILVVFAMILFAYSLFVAGADFANHNVSSGVTNLILAALWLYVLVVDHVGLILEVKYLRKIKTLSDEMFDNVEQLMHHLDVAITAYNSKKAKKSTKGGKK